MGPRLRSVTGLAFGSVLVMAGCQRSSSAPAGSQGRPVSAAAPTATGPTPVNAPSTEGVDASVPTLHPALGGHPPSYWFEQANQPVNSPDSVPNEVFGRQLMLYRAAVGGDLSQLCLCPNREGKYVGPPGRTQCKAYPVRGLTWASIPWARKGYRGLEAYVEFLGMLSPDGFEVRGRPRRPPPPEDSVVMRYPFPCEGQPDARRRRGTRVGLDDENAAMEYAEKQPEHSITYVHWFPGVTRKQQEQFTADKGAFVFMFTENLDQHRERLEALWEGPLCVAKAELTTELQRGIGARAAELLRREGKQRGLLCGSFATGMLAFPDRVTVTGIAWDSAGLERWLSRELGGFPVEVESTLMPAPEP